MHIGSIDDVILFNKLGQNWTSLTKDKANVTCKTTYIRIHQDEKQRIMYY